MYMLMTATVGIPSFVITKENTIAHVLIFSLTFFYEKLKYETEIRLKHIQHLKPVFLMSVADINNFNMRLFKYDLYLKENCIQLQKRQHFKGNLTLEK